MNQDYRDMIDRNDADNEIVEILENNICKYCRNIKDYAGTCLVCDNA